MTRRTRQNAAVPIPPAPYAGYSVTVYLDIADLSALPDDAHYDLQSATVASVERLLPGAKVVVFWERKGPDAMAAVYVVDAESMPRAGCIAAVDAWLAGAYPAILEDVAHA